MAPLFTVMGQPECSPEMVPLEFHLLPKLKRHLRGHHKMLENEVKVAVKLWSRQQDAQFYSDGHTELRERWRKGADCEGDHV
jgi:hypothetical protein